MKKDNIPKSVLERIENELLNREELLWAGLPRHKHITNSMTQTNAAISALLLGMVMFGFLAFMFLENSPGQSAPINFFTLIGLVVLGLTVAIAKGLYLLQGARNLVYAITDRRAIILSKNRVQSFAGKDLQFIERVMHRDGSGDIIFREEHYKRVAGGAIMTQKSERVTTGFYGVENPSEVEAIMLETFQGGSDQKRLYEVNEDEEDLYYGDEEELSLYQ